MIGIYKITNRINNKSYIGQSVNIRRRWAEHRLLHRDESLSLKRALRKYGIENFTFEVLEECCVHDLNDKEIYYINLIKPEYNRCTGGTGSHKHHVPHRTRDILREKGKAQWQKMTKEKQQQQIKNNLKGPSKGHSVSQETRAKLRNANLGKKQSRETIEKRIRTIKERGYVKTNAALRKPIYCIELGLTFESVKQAGEYLKVTPSCISGQLKGRYATVKGYHFSYCSVETNRDECSGVGQEIDTCSKREATLFIEVDDIVHSL